MFLPSGRARRLVPTIRGLKVTQATYLDREDRLHFAGRRSSAPERDWLRRHGFVHVTGLTVNCQGMLYHVGCRVEVQDQGVWNAERGLTVIITGGGEVWLRAGEYLLSIEEEKFLMLSGRDFSEVPPLTAHQEFTYAHRLLLARYCDPDANIIYDSVS